jgi:hypothetical protein
MPGCRAGEDLHGPRRRFSSAMPGLHTWSGLPVGRGSGWPHPRAAAALARAQGKPHRRVERETGSSGEVEQDLRRRKEHLHTHDQAVGPLGLTQPRRGVRGATAGRGAVAGLPAGVRGTYGAGALAAASARPVGLAGRCPHA